MLCFGYGMSKNVTVIKFSPWFDNALYQQPKALQ